MPPARPRRNQRREPHCHPVYVTDRGTSRRAPHQPVASEVACPLRALCYTMSDMTAAPQAPPPPVTEPPAVGDAPPRHPIGPLLVALAAVAGLAELAFILVNVSALPVYLKNGLGLPNLPGIALAAFYMAEALGNSPMGTLSDRVGRRRMMVLGASLSVFTCLATAFLRVPQGALGYLVIGAILVLRLLDGLGAAMLWPAVFATVGDRVESSKQAQAMSALNITYLIGIALGPAVGGFVNETIGGRYALSDPRRYVPSFFVAAACFAVTALIAYFVAPTHAEHKTRPRETAPEIAAALPRRAEEEGEEDGGHGKASLAALKKALRDAPWLMLLGFLIFFGVGLIAPYAKTFIMDRFDIGESAFALLLLWPALIIGAVSLPIGRLADRWGKSRAIHVGLAVCAAALWTLMFMQHKWSVVLVGSLLGVGFILAFPAYMAYLADLTGPEDRAGMIGAVRMAQGIGALLGAAFSSVLLTVDERHLTVFVTASVLVTLGWLLSLFSVHPRRGPRPTAM